MSDDPNRERESGPGWWVAGLIASCPECGAAQGETHWPGCVTAQVRFSLAEAVEVCHQRGWAVAYVAGEGFRPCKADEPGAYVDLDRYYYWLRFGEDDARGSETQPAGDA